MLRQVGGDGTPLGAISAYTRDSGDRIRELERLIRKCCQSGDSECDFCTAEDGSCGLIRSSPPGTAIESTYIAYAVSPFPTENPQPDGISTRPPGDWTTDFLSLADASWTSAGGGTDAWLGVQTADLVHNSDTGHLDSDTPCLGINYTLGEEAAQTSVVMVGAPGASPPPVLSSAEAFAEIDPPSYFLPNDTVSVDVSAFPEIGDRKSVV